MFNQTRLSSMLLAAALAGPVAAQTEFTYQGVLSDGSGPVTGTENIRFRLYDAPVGGTLFGETTQNVDVADGVFTAPLNLGTLHTVDSASAWLEIAVDTGGGSFDTLGRQKITAAPFAMNTRGIDVDQNGHVGIGTDATDYPLTTFGGVQFDGAAPHALRFSSSGQARLEIGIAEGPGEYSTIADIGDAVIRTLHTSGRIHLQSGVLSPGMTISDNNFVGIGTASPQQRLSVKGQIDVGDPSAASQSVRLFVNSGSWYMGSNNNGTGTSSNQFYIYDNASDRFALTVQRGSGRVGIGTTAPASMLDVNGAVTIRGGADIVEGFDSACGTLVEPGTLMVIDPEHPGKLMPSSQGYDAKVAGIVSGANGVNPGIKLGQDGTMDGAIPVAMTGRVYVKASAENGAIRPGDRLTSASLAGHAMKATDRDRADGAVIGKAMTGLDDGTGMVLVLVNLQ